MVPHPIHRLLCLLRLALLPLMVSALAPGIAHAGPWPRAKGDVFFSLSHEVGRDGGGWSALYAEYGLTPRWTLGLDIGNSQDRTTALAFVQRAVGKQDGPGRLAFSSGIGIETGIEPQAFGMVGAAWGRSLGTPLGPGWLAVEPQLRMGVALSEDWPPTLVLDEDGKIATTGLAKLDLTLGATARPGLILMGQVQMEQALEGDPTARLTASAVRDVGRRGKVLLGLSAPVMGEGEPSLKLGTWLEF